VDVLGPFAILQVAAGARAIQVFDSWVGALGPDDYVRYVAPYSRALIERIRSTGVPVIHFGTGAGGFFKELHAAGHAKLRVGRRQMAPNGGFSEGESLGDLPHGQTLDGDIEDLALPR